MEELSTFQQYCDDASSFIESLTPAELGRLLDLKLAKTVTFDAWLQIAIAASRQRGSRTADESAYWDAKSAENKFIKDMSIKHGRELSGISVLFLTTPFVKTALARKIRNARIASVLGPNPEGI